MTERIKYLSVTFLCITLAVCAGILTWRLNGTLREIRDTAAVMHATADGLGEAVRQQVAIFQSPAYQKNYEHASELGDIAAKTVAKVARETIPRANRAIDELTARLGDFGLTETQLTRATANLADFVAKTDASLNTPTGLIPSVTKIVNKTGVTLDEFDRALKIAAEGLGLTTEELKRRLADQRLDAMMDEALDILKEGRETMVEFHEASKQSPRLAADLEKIAHESSKFARISLIAGIISTLARAFIP